MEAKETHCKLKKRKKCFSNKTIPFLFTNLINSMNSLGQRTKARCGNVVIQVKRASIGRASQRSKRRLATSCNSKSRRQFGKHCMRRVSNKALTLKSNPLHRCLGCGKQARIFFFFFLRSNCTLTLSSAAFSSTSLSNMPRISAMSAPGYTPIRIWHVQ